MLTGARKTEIADLRWSEVDLDQALITLPAARTKARREHEIPLSAPALAILKAQPRDDERDLCSAVAPVALGLVEGKSAISMTGSGRPPSRGEEG